MAEDKSFTFRIPETLLERLQQLAADEDLSVAQLVRKALREFLEKNGDCDADRHQ